MICADVIEQIHTRNEPENNLIENECNVQGPSTKYDLFIRFSMEEIDKNEIFRNLKTPIEIYLA